MKVRIMIVDDSKFIYEDIKQNLEGTDFEVVAYCKDGVSAVATYPEVRPDIVTMDIIMPNLDGFETAEKIFQMDPEANIIFLSSLAYEETMEQAQRLGSADFLFKPLEKEKLIACLLKIVDTRLNKKAKSQ